MAAGVAQKREATRDALVFGSLLAGFWYFYARVSLIPLLNRGLTGDFFTYSVAEGRAPAPTQYRFVLAEVQHWLIVDRGLAALTVFSLFDVASIAVGGVFTARIARRFGASPPAVGLVWCWIGLGSLWVTRPETFVSFACGSVLAARLLGLSSRSSAVAAVAVLLFVRPDVLAAFGVSWLLAKKRSGWAMVGLAGFSMLATKLAWPDAAYYVPMFQLGYNVWHGSVLVLAVLTAPLWLQVWFLGLDRARDACGALLPLLGGLGSLVAVTLFVGRVNETRIFLPFAGPLAVAVVLLWSGAARPQVLDVPVERHTGCR